jgi:hypothetical protein
MLTVASMCRCARVLGLGLLNKQLSNVTDLKLLHYKGQALKVGAK